MPRNSVGPVDYTSDDGTSNTVTVIGTMILEFTGLSDITGNRNFARLVQRAEAYLVNPQPEYGEPFPGLLGSLVNVDSGYFLDSKGTGGLWQISSMSGNTFMSLYKCTPISMFHFRDSMDT